MELIPRQVQEETIKNSLKERNIFIVQAVSGSGKTSFFKYFLRKNKAKNIYISLSENDVEPVNFFLKIYKNSKLIQPQIKLPYPTVELLINIDLFSEKYFQILFNSNDIDYFVFDDLQNIKSNKDLLNVIYNLPQIVPPFKKIILISRDDFYFPYFSWDIEKRVFRVDTSFFRFSSEEIKQYFFSRYGKSLTKEEIDTILDSTDGIIGKMLLTDGSYFKSISKNLEHKIYSILTPEEVESLCKVSKFPSINENTVYSLKDRDHIISALEKLYLENLFVTTDPSGYRMHDILKNFLFIKAKKIFPDYKKFVKEHAQSLYEAGYLDEAISLLRVIKDKQSIYNLLKTSIIPLIYEGKLYSVKKYLSIIENSKYGQDPVFLFAKGYLLKFFEPDKAVVYLNKALNLFSKEKDIQGQKLVIGELFDVVQYYGQDFSIGGKYLKKAEELIQNTNNFSPEDIRLLSYTGIIYLLYQGNIKKSYYFFDLIRKAVEKNENDLTIFSAYTYLYSAVTCSAGGKFTEARDLFNKANQIYDFCEKNPEDIFMFNFLASMYETFVGEFQSAVERIEKIYHIIKSWGLLIHEEHMISRIVEGLLCMGKTAEARIYIDKIDQVYYRTYFSRAMTYQLKAQMYLQDKDLDSAVENAQLSIALFKKIHGKPFEMSTKSLLALIYTEKGFYSKAENILKKVINWSRKTGSGLQEFTSLIHLAYLYLKQDLEVHLYHTLKQAMYLGKKNHITAVYNQCPYILKEVLQKAINMNIEADFANYLMKYHSFNGEDPKIKIYTFGHFKVLLENKEITDWKGKKTLILLKTIVALGGENIPVERILDIIWDDADFIRAKQNFEFTLRKLRKILKDHSKEIVILKNNRISLNRKAVWIDLWEFEEIYSSLEFIINKNRLSLDYSKDSFKKLKSIYRGKFMELEDDIWIEQIRNEIDNKYKTLMSYIV